MRRGVGKKGWSLEEKDVRLGEVRRERGRRKSGD